MESRFKKILFEMLDDRGYQHTKKFKDNKTYYSLDAVGLNGENVMVLYIVKIGVQFIRSIEDQLVNEKKHYIFIYGQDITSFSKKKIDQLDISHEIFHKHFFLFNPTKHFLCPEHIKLNQMQKNDLVSVFKKKYSTDFNFTMLPKILTTDPISRWYYFKVDDIILIKRPLPNGNTMEVYRHTIVSI